MAIECLKLHNITIGPPSSDLVSRRPVRAGANPPTFDFNNLDQTIPSLSSPADKRLAGPAALDRSRQATSPAPPHSIHASTSRFTRFQAQSRNRTYRSSDPVQNAAYVGGGGEIQSVSEPMRELQEEIVRKRLKEVANLEQQLRLAEGLVSRGGNSWMTNQDGSRIKATELVERTTTRLVEAKEKLEEAREVIGRE